MPQNSALPSRLRGYLLLAVSFVIFLLTAEWWTFLHWGILTRPYSGIWQADGYRLAFSHRTNTFDLSLVVQVKDNATKSSDRWVLGRLIQRNHSGRQRYTFAEMAEIADGDWIYPIPRSVFSLYPQALDIKQVVADIRKGQPVPEPPIFSQTIRFLSVSSTVCVPGKAVERPLNAIVVIKSAVYNFADRDRIRRAFAEETQREPEFRMAAVFSVGLPRSSGGRFFQRDGFNITLPDRAGESMLKMQFERSEVLRNLTEEARVNGDLVLGDYEDTYYNLSLKLFHTFQWASTFCRPHFISQQRPPVFVVLDDDYAFNASVLKTELGALNDTQIRRVTWGLKRVSAKVYRPFTTKAFEKWSVSKREMPWPYYTPFAYGIFLVFGADVMQEIALAMYFTLQFPIDDAWLGLVMTKLDLDFQTRPHMYKVWPKGVRKELILFARLDYLFPLK